MAQEFPVVSRSSFEFLLMEAATSFKEICAAKATQTNAAGESEEDATPFSGYIEAQTRLQSLGLRVGQGLLETHAQARPPFKQQVDILKFVCKEMWMIVFGKSIDSLRTNKKAVYVLTDETFPPFTRMGKGTQYLEEATYLISFPVGLIKGALAAVGIVCSVKADVPSLPSCRFHIEIRESLVA